VLKRRNTVLGAGRYGKAADMWSLGIILYVLLSGTHPFHDNTLYEQVSASHTILTSCNLVHQQQQFVSVCTSQIMLCK
jgi:serine/threonine protein kinase